MAFAFQCGTLPLPRSVDCNMSVRAHAAAPSLPRLSFAASQPRLLPTVRAARSGRAMTSIRASAAADTTVKIIVQVLRGSGLGTHLSQGFRAPDAVWLSTHWLLFAGPQRGGHASHQDTRGGQGCASASCSTPFAPFQGHCGSEKGTSLVSIVRSASSPETSHGDDLRTLSACTDACPHGHSILGTRPSAQPLPPVLPRNWDQLSGLAADGT